MKSSVRFFAEAKRHISGPRPVPVFGVPVQWFSRARYLTVTLEMHVTWYVLAAPFEQIVSQRLGLLGFALSEEVTCPSGMVFALCAVPPRLYYDAGG